MNQTDIGLVLKKADELRSLFVLGQRILPFLEEIFVFVSEIEPLLNEINSSIKENLKKMPNASKQLSKVTEATELATNEIMDIVDGLVYKSEIISGNVNKLHQLNHTQLDKQIELLEIIHRGIQQGSNLKSILPELSAAIKTLKSTQSDEVDSLVSNTKDILSSILMDSSSIMMSLQVQDITSQQIAAVNNLLETIQGKLGRILDHFNSSDVSSLVSTDTVQKKYRSNVSKLHRNIAFDPDAVDAISNQAERQKQVDELVNQRQAADDLDEPVSADDIDALFSGGNINNAPIQEDLNEEVSADDIDALFGGGNINNMMASDDLTEEASTDDIDALFNATLNSTPPDSRETPEVDDPFAQFSQDDIDAMFGK